MKKGEIAGPDYGFRGWDKERQRYVASVGGRTAHALGTAHQWTSAEARAASLKGHANRKAKKEAKAQEEAERQRAEDRMIRPPYGGILQGDGGAY